MSSSDDTKRDVMIDAEAAVEYLRTKGYPDVPSIPDVNGDLVLLPPIHLRLFSEFVRYPDQCLTYDALTLLLYEQQRLTGDSRIQVAMSRLRRSLGWSTDSPVMTVTGFGYRWVA